MHCKFIQYNVGHSENCTYALDSTYRAAKPLYTLLQLHLGRRELKATIANELHTFELGHTQKRNFNQCTAVDIFAVLYNLLLLG